jgi:hypothetical protein
MPTRPHTAIGRNHDTRKGLGRELRDVGSTVEDDMILRLRYVWRQRTIINHALLKF